MKKSLMAIVILLFCFSVHSFAQDGARQQIEKIRKDAYTRVLSLSEDEAKKFWPVFDEMQEELNQINKKAKIERININRNYNKLTEAQMQRAVENLLTLEQEALDVKKKYYQKFMKIIPVKKVALFPKADREFHKDLISLYKGLKDADE
jgi:hypothetical protein